MLGAGGDPAGKRRGEGPTTSRPHVRVLRAHGEHQPGESRAGPLQRGPRSGFEEKTSSAHRAPRPRPAASSGAPGQPGSLHSVVSGRASTSETLPTKVNPPKDKLGDDGLPLGSAPPGLGATARVGFVENEPKRAWSAKAGAGGTRRGWGPGEALRLGLRAAPKPPRPGHLLAAVRSKSMSEVGGARPHAPHGAPQDTPGVPCTGYAKCITPSCSRGNTRRTPKREVVCYF